MPMEPLSDSVSSTTDIGPIVTPEVIPCKMSDENGVSSTVSFQGPNEMGMVEILSDEGNE